MENSAKRKPRLSKPKKIILILIIAAVILFSLVNFITDFLWFSELGYLSVFLKQLFTQLMIGIPVFVIVTMLAYVYLKVMKKKFYGTIESEQADRPKLMNRVSWGLAAVYGVIITYVCVSKTWFNLLKFGNSQSFDIKDPMFKHDISFYVFKLDFINQVLVIAIGAVIGLLALTLLYYFLLMNEHRPVKEETADNGSGADFGNNDDFGSDDGRGNGLGGGGGFAPFRDGFDKFTRSFQGNVNRPKHNKQESAFENPSVKQFFSIASKQVMIQGALLFLFIGCYFFLKQYTLLNDHTGAVYGAGFTDVNITMWVYRIVAVLGLAGAVAVVIAIRKQITKPIIIVPTAMIAVGILGVAVALLVQNFVVSPDELSKESKYLQRNIEYTQRAYNLDQVTTKKFAATNDLTSEDIQNNEPTMSNIRINDFKPAKTFYNQTQAIRQYYDFNDVDVDRYTINGKYTQTFLAAREIDESKISDTWLNRHLKYTHGYGITMSQVDQVTASGQPQMLVGGIPPESDASALKVTRPEIYFGEMTNDYLLTGADDDEFDYPDGDNNKYTRYEGSAGIKLNLFNRIMFSIREHSLKLLVSTNIKSDSKIIIYRNVAERLQKIMPYLSYENDPYMVTVNGKLYWIMDAYTTSNRYPYSEPYETDTDATSDTNYIRNSVKVVVDAYNGDTNYYVVDDNDAIAKTYQKIYPKLFKNFDEMPAALKAHIRYPNTMFGVQAEVYQRYHMNDVKVFYQNEDLWSIANETYGTKTQPMTPNYYILNLPGEKDAEFVNSIPFTPKDKRNMTGLLMARNDGKNYGKLVLFKLPKSRAIYGPEQMEAQIDQNTEISKEFSLWNSAGSKYTRGNMFVIPIEDSILYVEPVYLEATNSSIPEVKRVIVCYGDQIAYESNLADALDSLFGDGAGDGYSSGNANNKKTSSSGSSQSLSQSDLIKKAQDAYDNAQSALKDGNWAKYGDYMDNLREYLNKLK